MKAWLIAINYYNINNSNNNNSNNNNNNNNNNYDNNSSSSNNNNNNSNNSNMFLTTKIVLFLNTMKCIAFTYEVWSILHTKNVLCSNKKNALLLNTKHAVF